MNATESVSRIEAAAAIERHFDSGDEYLTSVWAKGGFVRIYFDLLRSRGRRDPIGYVSIEDDGSVDCSRLSRRKGTIDGEIAELGLLIEAGSIPVEDVNDHPYPADHSLEMHAAARAHALAIEELEMEDVVVKIEQVSEMAAKHGLAIDQQAECHYAIDGGRHQEVAIPGEVDLFVGIGSDESTLNALRDELAAAGIDTNQLHVSKCSKFSHYVPGGMFLQVCNFKI